MSSLVVSKWNSTTMGLQRALKGRCSQKCEVRGHRKVTPLPVGLLSMGLESLMTSGRMLEGKGFESQA